MRTVQIIYTSLMSVIFILLFFISFPYQLGRSSGMLVLLSLGILAIWKDREMIRETLILTIIEFTIFLVAIHIWGFPF